MVIGPGEDKFYFREDFLPSMAAVLDCMKYGIISLWLWTSLRMSHCPEDPI